jgi:two-component system, OmpR family, response regulator
MKPRNPRSASAPSSHDLFLAAFTINIAEFKFRYTQGPGFFTGKSLEHRGRHGVGVGLGTSKGRRSLARGSSPDTGHVWLAQRLPIAGPNLNAKSGDRWLDYVGGDGRRMRILFIEDDVETANYVVNGLRKSGHVTDHATDGQDGLLRGLSGRYDIIVVDRMLPTLDGLRIVKTLRSAGVDVPALFLTALAEIDDRVEGLEGGADDYLTKPFAFSELIARINALARRPRLTPVETTLRVADLEMDLVARRVTRGGVVIDLQPRDFQLLEYLMRNAEKVVTRTMLLEKVWEFHFDPKTKIVESQISRLRAKVTKEGAPELIHTVRGFGYVIRPPA